MKIKDITISIFAIIGFVTILSSFNNQTHDTVPESHEWEMHLSSGSNRTFAYSINKKTGEVRQHESLYSSMVNTDKKTSWKINHFASYRVSVPK